MKRTLFVILATTALLACSGDQAPQQGSTPKAPPGIKGDSLAGAECSWSTPSPLGDDSWTLSEFVVASKEVTMDNMEILTELEARQIFAAVQHLGWSLQDEDFDMVFQVADEGEIETMEVEVQGRDLISAQWVRFYAGDTEVGVIFALGTMDIIAEVGDGDIMGCGTEPVCSPVMCEVLCTYGFKKDENGCEICACADEPTCSPVMCEVLCTYGFKKDDSGCEICACADEPTTQTVCDYSYPSPVGDDSEVLDEQTVSIKTVTIDDLDTLTELETRQIVKAAKHCSLILEDIDIDSVFEAADEGTFYLLQVELNAPTFFTADWVQFYAGDTEVGAIFADNTTDIIAEVGDGDIAGCRQE